MTVQWLGLSPLIKPAEILDSIVKPWVNHNGITSDAAFSLTADLFDDYIDTVKRFTVGKFTATLSKLLKDNDVAGKSDRLVFYTAPILAQEKQIPLIDVSKTLEGFIQTGLASGKVSLPIKDLQSWLGFLDYVKTMG